MNFQSLSKPISFALVFFITSTCYGADERVCRTRTKEQQVALMQRMTDDVKKNDNHADAAISVVEKIYYGQLHQLVGALNTGVDPNMEVDVGVGFKLPLLDIAISACQTEVAIALINGGANVNGNSMSTPIVNAADNGMDSVVAALIAHHALLEKKDSDGDTALRDAVAQGHYSTVKLLLEAGANVNDTGHPGESLLGNGGGDGNARKIAALLTQFGAKDKTL